MLLSHLSNTDYVKKFLGLWNVKKSFEQFIDYVIPTKLQWM
jgi:hypothetical protein